jgi:hypothetical protein
MLNVIYYLWPLFTTVYYMYGMIMPFMILLMLPGAKLTSFTQGNDHIIPYMGKFLCGHQKKS